MLLGVERIPPLGDRSLGDRSPLGDLPGDLPDAGSSPAAPPRPEFVRRDADAVTPTDPDFVTLGEADFSPFGEEDDRATAPLGEVEPLGDADMTTTSHCETNTNWQAST